MSTFVFVIFYCFSTEGISYKPHKISIDHGPKNYPFDTKVLSLDNSYYLTAAFLFAKNILKSFIFLPENRILLGHIYLIPAMDKASFCSLLESFQAHYEWPYEGFFHLCI